MCIRDSVGSEMCIRDSPNSKVAMESATKSGMVRDPKKLIFIGRVTWRDWSIERLGEF
jgi:hypothetical protein